MSYQVLARKWRPRDFTELVGQEHVQRALVNALDNDRLHHAYLFTGTRGVGKTTLLVDAVRMVERSKKNADDAEHEEDDPVYARRHWLSAGGRIIAGMRYLGEWEQRCEAVIDQLDDVQ